MFNIQHQKHIESEKVGHYTIHMVLRNIANINWIQRFVVREAFQTLVEQFEKVLSNTTLNTCLFELGLKSLLKDIQSI